MAMSKSQIFLDTVKSNKISTFLALGGLAVTACIEKSLMQTELIGTQGLMLASSLGLGYLMNKHTINKAVKTGRLEYLSKTPKITTAFLAVGATVGVHYLAHSEIPFRGVGMLIMGAIAAGSAFSVFNDADKIKKKMQDFRRKAFEKEMKKQEKLHQKQTVQEQSEFAPLRFK